MTQLHINPPFFTQPQKSETEKYTISLTTRPLYLRGKSPPVNRKLGGPQSRYGSSGQEKNLLHLPGTELRLVYRPTGSLVTTPTELSSSQHTGNTDGYKKLDFKAHDQNSSASLISPIIQYWECNMIDRYDSCTQQSAVPLQAWSGPEGSSRLGFPDFMTTAQDGGMVVSLTHRPSLSPGNAPGTHFC